MSFGFKLLFFHPNYLNQILIEESDAIVEAPLKIILRELSDGEVKLFYPNPLILFIHYQHLKNLSQELKAKVDQIVRQI